MKAMTQKRLFPHWVLWLIVLVGAFCAGCVHSAIHEDEIRSDLPALDPETGLAKEITCTLYTRVLEEAYLTGIQRSLEVPAGEKTEAVIVNAMLAEPAAISGAAYSLFPEGTRIVDINLDGTILYVTLSHEFLGRQALQKEQSSLERDRENGRITKEEYEKRQSRLLEAYYTRLRLGVYAVVNTLTDYNEDMRVLLLVDAGNSGTGDRLPRSELGLPDTRSGGAGLIEPMRYNDEYTITPQLMAELFLTHLQNGEYEKVYAMLSSEDETANPKPDYTRLESDIKRYGKLKSFGVNGMMNGDNRVAYMNIDVCFVKPDGEEVSLTNRRLLMRSRDGLFRPDYASFKRLLEEL